MKSLNFPALLALAVFLPVIAPASALDTHLEPGTIADFQKYSTGIEQQLSQQWVSPSSSLVIEDNPKDLKKVLSGDVVVHPSVRNTPVVIDNGLIHDWTGSAFFPNTSIAAVIKVLQDFDRDADMFPEIVRSHLISRDGNHITGYWRVERKTAMLDVVLDVDNDTVYREVAPGRWICEAHSTRIEQVEDAGTPKERKLPVGEGYGFLWRMNNYWVFQAHDGGVLVECRNLSLSRQIPGAVAWMVNSIVKEQPRISLTSTLQETRKAVESRVNR